MFKGETGETRTHLLLRCMCFQFDSDQIAALLLTPMSASISRALLKQRKQTKHDFTSGLCPTGRYGDSVMCGYTYAASALGQLGGGEVFLCVCVCVDWRVGPALLFHRALFLSVV